MVLRAEAAGAGLITPHGDREPVRRERLARAAVDSLPLMGIGNRRCPGVRRRGTHTHYPSWGSGTRAPEAAPASTFRSHYPSWGSGTLDPGRREGEPVPLITPHGDREQAPTCLSGTSLICSLPLMGIGNQPHLQQPLDLLHLITPHGDREPGAAAHGATTLHAHYPSWGSGTSLIFSALGLSVTASLPLMGIGNPWRRHRFKAPGICSLPLMGIGNAGVDIARRRDLWVSLPLMGIGNGRRTRESRGLMSGSLPLMGIGNREEAQGASHRYGLITPHGDRERRPWAGPTAPPTAHYPSWGSGTPVGGAAERHRLRLITPHGDRERRGGHRPTAGPVGLITPHGDREPLREDLEEGVDLRSLPLMGIGNRTCLPRWSRPAPAHYPSWGSGTQPASAEHVLQRELITPHGDREPRSGGHASDSAARSLPLMGIGNPRSCGTARASGWTHYPSWGSGTAAAPDRVSGSLRLITPHGDRELPVRSRSSTAFWSSLPLMGIGNAGRPAPGTARASCPHYPSWGSGTSALDGPSAA